MSQVVIATDAALELSGELGFPTPRPFGHFVMHLATTQRDFCIVSEARGLLGYFEDPALAQPFLRMLVRNATHGRGRLDFRLWRWCQGNWETYQRSIPMNQPTEAAA